MERHEGSMEVWILSSLAEVLGKLGVVSEGAPAAIASFRSLEEAGRMDDIRRLMLHASIGAALVQAVEGVAKAGDGYMLVVSGGHVDDGFSMRIQLVQVDEEGRRGPWRHPRRRRER